MFNWLWNAISRARASLEVKQIAARVDQLELEWTDTLDKLRAREERERKRKKTAIAAAAEGDCVDCGHEGAPAPVENSALKADLWAQGRSLFSKPGRRMQ